MNGSSWRSLLPQPNLTAKTQDRKMEDRKMFVVCSLLHGDHCFDDTKLNFSVFHFSVSAFVQANLTWSSYKENLHATPSNGQALSFPGHTAVHKFSVIAKFITK